MKIFTLKHRIAHNIMLSAVCVFITSHTWAKSQSDAVNPLNYKAIVIGINEYNNHANGWESLRTARNDAEAVADLLENDYGFSVTRLMDHQATRGGILDALDQLASCTPNDAVVIYYAGHGIYDDKLDEGFWIPSDARVSTDGHSAREDWIWNSVITRIIEASKARHVLVIADACYSGSLFRGRGSSAIFTQKDPTWYLQAINKPSRFLITSGDYEPVLDSGFRHSVFARVLLNLLKYPDNDFLSVTEMGLTLREKVGHITGQMVRVGPLAVSAHAGGEFVFPANQRARSLVASFLGTNTMSMAQAETLLDNDTAPQRLNDNDIIKNIALLQQRGAVNSAELLGESLNKDNETTKQLLPMINEQAQAHTPSRIWVLMDELETIAKAKTDDDYQAPESRVLTVMDSVPYPTGSPKESTSYLYEMCLMAELRKQPGLKVVERDVMESIFNELKLGSSELSDERFALQMGKLFPASAILVPRVIFEKDDNILILRLIDTQTSEVIDVVSQKVDSLDTLPSTCAKLAVAISTTVNQQAVE